LSGRLGGLGRLMIILERGSCITSVMVFALVG
jgi:hypothetical protein